MWFTNDNPQLEVAFNGGCVNVERLSDDEIKVGFNLICGPTYHMAYFAGKAKKIGENKYESKGATEYGDPDNPCHLIFTFKDKVLTIDQESSSMACGFGARAYAGGEFIKVNDNWVGEEEPTVSEALGR